MSRGRCVEIVLVAFLCVATLSGCGGDDADEVATPEVAVCDDLRRRENVLIGVVNEALAELSDAGDDQARTEAIARGFDRLISVLADQAGTVTTSEPALTDQLNAGTAAALAELEEERDRFADEVDVVTLADEHGRASQLQNALEKAFSLMEPPRSAYVAVGLGRAIDVDPDCRFVTQRGDPAR